MAGNGQTRPASPLDYDDLKPKQRRDIEEVINAGRQLDVVVDQILALFADQIEQKITAALGSRLKRAASAPD